jgi:hypothetical protein
VDDTRRDSRFIEQNSLELAVTDHLLDGGLERNETLTGCTLPTRCPHTPHTTCTHRHKELVSSENVARAKLSNVL